MDESTQNPANCIQALIVRHFLMVYRLAYVRTGNKHDADDIFHQHERAFLSVSK